jgi:hypothetical protein
MTTEGRIEIYTTASSMLDLQETHVLNSDVGETATGRPFRLVSVPEQAINEQIKAYVTSMHCALSSSDWKIEIQFGNIIEHAMEKSA